MTTTKRRAGCGRDLPLTAFYFSRGYLFTLCKPCHNLRASILRQKREYPAVRRCRVCGETKPAEAFGKHEATLCKACNAAKTRARWASLTPEERAEAGRIQRARRKARLVDTLRLSNRRAS